MKFDLRYGAGLLALSASSAFAQSPPAPSVTIQGSAPAADGDSPTVSDGAIEDILVVAQKGRFAQKLQTVPVAISAFSGDILEARNIQNITQIGYTTPNARLQQVGTIPGYANFAFRGIGFNSSTPSDEPTVVTVLDGMVLGTAAGAILDTLDVEGVEVLRGPQGVLFGKNATGGAVTLRSRRPDGVADLRATALYGSYDRYAGSLAFEPELNSDLISMRLAASYNHQGGYFKNLTIPGDRGGEAETFTIRPVVKLQMSDRLSLTLIGQYQRYEGDGTIATGISPNTISTTRYGVQTCTRKRTICNDSASKARWNSKHIIGEINYEIGNGTLTSITAYREYFITSSGNDVDGTAAPVFTISPLTFDQHQFSQEVRYAGAAFDDRLNYTIGTYYFDQGYTFEEQRLIGSGPGRPLTSVTGKSAQIEWQAAIFGQVNFRFTDTLSASLGARYTDQTKRARIVPIGANACPDFKTCPFTFAGKFTSSNFGPKAGIEWKPDRDILVYTSYTRGYRAGGFNLRTPAPTIPRPYGDERVDAFELGAKTEWFDRRFRLNLTAFRNKFDDLQRQNSLPSPLGTQQLVLNAASARIQGIEAEAVLLPVEGLRFDASLGYLDAKYLSFTGVDLTGDGIPDPDLAKRLRLERAPKWTYSLGASYTVRWGNDRELRLSTNYSYTGNTPVNTTNLGILPAIKLLDADISFRLTRSVEVGLFGKNLANRTYGELSNAALPTFYNLYLSPPRTFGLELRYTL